MDPPLQSQMKKQKSPINFENPWQNKTKDLSILKFC